MWQNVDGADEDRDFSAEETAAAQTENALCISDGSNYDEDDDEEDGGDDDEDEGDDEDREIEDDSDLVISLLRRDLVDEDDDEGDGGDDDEDEDDWDVRVVKSTVKALFNASRAALGQLKNDQFETFIDKLDLEEDGEEEEDDIVEGDDEDSEDEDGYVEEDSDLVISIVRRSLKSGVDDLSDHDDEDGIDYDADSYEDEDEDEIDGDDEDDMEEISIEEAFEELSQGRSRATLDAICEWNIVKELLEEGTLTKEVLTNLAIQVSLFSLLPW